MSIASIELPNDPEALRELALRQQHELHKKSELLDEKVSLVDAFSDVLPPKKVMRFYQVENKLDAIIDYRLAQSVPLPQVAEGPPAE